MTTSKIYEVVVRTRVQLDIIDGECDEQHLRGAAATAQELAMTGDFDGQLVMTEYPTGGGLWWDNAEDVDPDRPRLCVVDWCLTDEQADETISKNDGVIQ